jgi:hypothetical protein
MSEELAAMYGTLVIVDKSLILCAVEDCQALADNKNAIGLNPDDIPFGPYRVHLCGPCFEKHLEYQHHLANTREAERQAMLHTTPQQEDL